MKNLFKNFFLVFLTLLLVASLIGFFDSNKVKVEEVDISRMVYEINNENIEKIFIESSQVILDLKAEDQTDLKIKLAPNQSFYDLISNYKIEAEKLDKINISFREDSGFSFWFSLIAPWLMPLFLFVFLIYFFSVQYKMKQIKL